MFFRSHRSPAWMLPLSDPLCMSLTRLGITNATVGRSLNFAGKSANLRLAEVSTLVPFGTFEKLIQGTCFRGKSAAPEAGEPIFGRSSEYPLKVRSGFAPVNLTPRLEAVN